MAAQWPIRLRGRGTCRTERCTEFEKETSAARGLPRNFLVPYQDSFTIEDHTGHLDRPAQVIGHLTLEASSLFQSAVSRGPRAAVQRTDAAGRFLLAYLKMLEMFPFSSQTRVIFNRHVQCTSQFA